MMLLVLRARLPDLSSCPDKIAAQRGHSVLGNILCGALSHGQQTDRSSMGSGVADATKQTGQNASRGRILQYYVAAEESACTEQTACTSTSLACEGKEEHVDQSWLTRHRD